MDRMKDVLEEKEISQRELAKVFGKAFKMVNG